VAVSLTLTPSHRRHAIVGLVTLGVCATVVVLTGVTPELWIDVDEPKADSWLWRLSVAAADTALVLLVATLLWGPVHVWRGGRPAVHHPWRRALGIWAGSVALAHVSLAVFVHARWQKVWSNWLEISPPRLVGGDRGLANWLGLFQVVLIVMLLWLSRDDALRRLGARTWKWLQRSVYVLGIMVAVHALLYHRIEERITAHRVPVLVLISLALIGQVSGVVFVLWRTRMRRSPPHGGAS
jgi:sulfoxide reductase heme-binding subunit YedZ